MRFDLTDLRLFLQIVEVASITHGADRAGLALASASARVRGMEEMLGVPLLERGRRGVRPTPAGRSLAHHAALVLRQVEAMRGDLSEHAAGVRGRIRMLCNTAALTEFLPAPLAAYLAAHPAIDVDLEERPSEEIVPAVAAGLADIGIVSDHVPLDGIDSRAFRTDRLVLVVPVADPLAGSRSVAFRDVIDRRFVGLPEGNALQIHLDRHAARLGRPLDFRIRLPGFDTVCRMVEQSVGIAVVPETAARGCRRSMAIRVVRLSDAWAVRRLAICTRRGEPLPAYAQRLVEMLVV